MNLRIFFVFVALNNIVPQKESLLLTRTNNIC